MGDLCQMAEPVGMLFVGLTVMGPRNHVLDGGPDPHGGSIAERYQRRAVIVCYILKVLYL